MSKRDAFIGLAIATAIFITADTLRLKVNVIKILFLLIFSSILRKEEVKSFTGGTHLFLAAIISLLIFDKFIFIAAISFLIIGDTLAAWIGQRYGRIRFGRKSLEGSMAAFIGCLGVTFVVSLLAPQNFPLIIGVMGAAVAALVEFAPIEVNDNVMIPILSGVFMQLTYEMLF